MNIGVFVWLGAVLALIVGAAALVAGVLFIGLAVFAGEPLLVSGVSYLVGGGGLSLFTYRWFTEDVGE